MQRHGTRVTVCAPENGHLLPWVQAWIARFWDAQQLAVCQLHQDFRAVYMAGSSRVADNGPAYKAGDGSYGVAADQITGRATSDATQGAVCGLGLGVTDVDGLTADYSAFGQCLRLQVFG